jgi:phage terminase small subunit
MDSTYRQTLMDAISTMDEKIRANLEEYSTAPLTITLMTASGEHEKVNPFVQEYRDMVKDFSKLVQQLDALGEDVSDKVTSLKDIRARLGVAK